MNEIFVAAAGTGGHIFPALSIAQHISRDYPVRFIGTKRGMEKNLVTEAGFPLSFIRARGWKGSGRWLLGKPPKFRKGKLSVELFRMILIQD